MLKFNWPGTGTDVSYHNHSNWSDGASSPEEMCRTAKALGLREFGLSDHWVISPAGKCSWSLPHERLDGYVKTLQAMQQELNDDRFTLRIGLEVDYFSENVDAVLAELKQYPFDYLIGSVHFAGTFGVDESREEWLALTEAEKERICEIYWRKMEEAAARPEFSFLGHLDLPKKFALIRNETYFPHAKRVLEILSCTGGALELNTAGWFKEAREAYPSPAICHEAASRRIPVVITSDAHAKEHITRGFDKAAEILKEQKNADASPLR